MRKLLLSAFCALSLNSFALDTTIQKVATFDFHNYETLTPAVDFGISSNISVENKIFTSKDASFYVVSSPYLPFVLNQNIKPDWCGLQFVSHATVAITVAEGCQLDSIDMCNEFYDGVGGLLMTDDTNKGSYKFGFWTAEEEEGIRIVKFTNHAGSDAVLSAIKVYYSAPANVLTYRTISPAMNAETDPFTGYTFTFASDIKIEDGATFIVTNADEQEVCALVPSVNGNTLVLTPAAPITQAGTYTLSVSEAAISNADKEYNKAFQTTFSVKDYPNTFLPLIYSFEDGKVKCIPQDIVLTFPKAIGQLATNTLDLIIVSDESEEPAVLRTASLSIDNEDATKLNIQFEVETTELGTYMFTIPENTILAADEFHYNPEIIQRYEVVGYDVPTESQILQAADLLSHTGIGYPKTLSDVRTALSEVVNGENKTYQEYDEAITNFLTSSDVVYPEYGKYYTIALVNDVEDEEKKYIGYDNEQFSSTPLAENAEHFLFVDVEGDRYVQLYDGTLLKVTVSKAVDEQVPALAFGLLDIAIEGYTEESNGRGYVLSVTTSRDPKVSPVIVPADGVEVDVLTTITVTINEAENIQYNPENPIVMTVKDSDKNDVPVDVISGITVEDNVLTITTSIKKDDIYTVNVPQGAITFYSIDHDVEVKAFSATYNVSELFGYNYDLLVKYPVSNNLDMSVPHTADEMNNFVVYCTRTNIYINEEDCEAFIQNQKGERIFTGTLESKSATTATANKNALSFNFGTELNAENLPDGIYDFVIMRGSFGDETFGRYLDGDEGIAKHDCHLLNSPLVYRYTIDKNATGVKSLKAGTAAESEIYDISGRRVNGKTAAGIYIIGGKKIYVK